MFSRLATKYFRNNTQDIFLLHPEQLLRLIEAVWSAAPRKNETDFPLESGGRPSLHALLKYQVADMLSRPNVGDGVNPINQRFQDLRGVFPGPLVPDPDDPPRIDWGHLIYAYMLENTRMVQIFHRVLEGYLHGEDLGTPSPTTVAWLRNTEALFYRHLPGTYMMNIRSEIRPDPESTRRNAYYRFFGMDLGHGTFANKPYPYHKPKHANRNFVSVFEKLLREIHKGLINRSNSSGANATDYASMVNLFKSLASMLQLRRQGGNMSRAEFSAVTMMSWFHLTLEQKDFSLVDDLSAKANSPEDRLLKIGQRVGLPANPKSGNFFELGSLLSQFLLLVEDDQFNNFNDVKLLFTDSSQNNYFPPLMTKIIDQWENATGKSIKGISVRPALGLH